MTLYKKLLPSGATVIYARCDKCGSYVSVGEKVDIGRKRPGIWPCKKCGDE